MKKLIEELVLQLLIDQIIKAIYLLAEWLSSMPWQIWFF